MEAEDITGTYETSSSIQAASQPFSTTDEKKPATNALNPNATPFQFSSAAPSFQPPILGMGLMPESSQPLLGHQLLYPPYATDPSMLVGGPSPYGGMLPAGALYMDPVDPGLHVPRHMANNSSLVMGDEIQVLLSIPYRAKVLPPPLPFAMHNKIWARNVCEMEEEHEGPDGNGMTDEEKHPPDSNTSEYSFSSEDAYDKSQRLQAYRLTMDRWFKHIQILEEKPEIANRSSRKIRPCRSYEEMLKQHRSMNVNDGDEHGEPDEEEVLRAWSDECVKWWQDSSKKKRRARKKRPEEFYTKNNDNPSDSLPLHNEWLVSGAGIEELNLIAHHSAAPLLAADRSYSNVSDLQFDDILDDGDISDALASELLLQFED